MFEKFSDLIRHLYSNTYMVKFFIVGITVAIFNFFTSRFFISITIDPYHAITLSYWIGVILHFYMHLFFKMKNLKLNLFIMFKYGVFLLGNNVLTLILSFLIFEYFNIEHSLVFFISPIVLFVFNYFFISRVVYTK